MARYAPLVHDQLARPGQERGQASLARDEHGRAAVVARMLRVCAPDAGALQHLERERGWWAPAAP